MEKAHDVSVDEPSAAHQVILFILDVLIRNGQEMEVDYLYQTFGDTSFTPQMLRAIGNSEDGLKMFLHRYPSLFTITTTSVANSITESKDADGDVKITVRANSGADSSSIFDKFHQPSSTMISGSTGTRGLATACSGAANNSYRQFFRPSSFGVHGTQHSSKYASDASGLSNLILGNDNALNVDSKSMKEIEQEALVFFKKQMTRKEEEWLPIVSVAGHASQASSNIRKFVGPQNEFIHFLRKYPDIFVVRDEYCGLKGKADKPHVRFPPPSPPPKRRSSDNTMSIGRSVSFNKHSMMNGGRFFNGTSKLNTLVMSGVTNDGPSSAVGLLAGSSNHPSGYSSCQGDSNASTSSSMHLQLSPLEVKAVHYIMRLLHRCGKTLVQNVPTLLSRAPEPLVKTIGQTKDQCVKFFKVHSAIFQLHPDSCVSVKHDAVRALIHKDKSLTENSVFTSSGIVLRIFPKYGILNTENNEQVFFDIQSCQFESFGDLACILHPGDRLWFNAILGPKDGSTKWRSLKTWIKTKITQVEQHHHSPQQSGDKATNVDHINSPITQFDSGRTCSKSNAVTTNSASCSKNLQAAINNHFGYTNNQQVDGEQNHYIRRFSSDGISSKSSIRSECTSNSREKVINDADLEQYELGNDISVHTDSMSFALNVSTTTSDDDDRSVFGTNDRSNANAKSTAFQQNHKLIERLNRNIKRGENQQTGWSANTNVNDSIRSTSMIDLRSLTSSLPVLAASHDRIGFVPIGCQPKCLDYTGGQHNDQNPSNPSSGSDALKICLDPRIIRKQVYSDCQIGISDKITVDEGHVSVSVQTVSSGEILATNIFVE